jgi:hypothetical protein
MELRAIGRAPHPKSLVFRKFAGRETACALRQREAVAMPLKRREGVPEPGKKRIRLAVPRHADGSPAELQRQVQPVLGAIGARQDLRPEADTEDGLA